MRKQNDYRYTGFNSQGTRIKGKCTAFTKEEAQKKLNKQDIQIVKIHKSHFCGLFNKKLRQHDIIFFLQQLSILLSSGVSLLQAINIFEQDNSKKIFESLMTTCKNQLIQGESFYSAIAKHPHIFNPLTINLINISEQTGTLTATLTKLADDLEKRIKSQRNLQLAMYYPLGVLSLSIAIIIFLLIFIVPQFSCLFQTFDATLPLSTKFVIHFSNFVQNQATSLLSGLFIVSVSCYSLFKKSKSFRKWIEILKLKIPFVGKILQKSIIARLMHTLATTLGAGLPLIDALTLLTSITNHHIYTEATITIQNEVTSGGSLHEAMKVTTRFPARVTQMIAIAEESATLEKMLYKIAVIYEKEVEDAMEKFSKILEPVMMLALGGIVGFFVLTLYQPIFKLGSVF